MSFSRRRLVLRLSCLLRPRLRALGVGTLELVLREKKQKTVYQTGADPVNLDPTSFRNQSRGTVIPNWGGVQMEEGLGRSDITTNRGCTLGANFKFVKGRKSVILGVWAAPGAPETLPKGGG